MSTFFNNDSEIFSAEAPGRMDVMGGIADYSGSMLLQMPIRQTTRVRLQKRKDKLIALQSLHGKNKADSFAIESAEISGRSYEELSALMKTLPGGDWAAYIIGCIAVLNLEKKLPVEGLSIEVSSTVPVGKGVSSSAALEIACMKALTGLYNIETGNTELPLLAQKAENLVVGAPCGLMDQLSSYLGKKNRLIPLQCQPHTVFETIPIPSGVTFCAIDSGIRHAVSGASYSEVRAAAFMAYTIIAKQAGATDTDLLQARQTGRWENLPFGGYLANITPSLFGQHYAGLLPDTISGKEFLENYKTSIDTVTRIVPETSYRVKACATHPVMENFRINTFMNLLGSLSRQKDKKKSLTILGELMCQSHASYSSVGLGNEHTDDILDRVRKAGSSSQVYGARITGGGSGGTVCILCEGREGVSAARKIYDEYRRHHRLRSFFFTGSSDGALFLES